MNQEIKAETIEALQALGKALGGTGEIKSIIPVRICDHCQDEDQEAHPYGIHDANGNYWHHLCNECYDALGCSFPLDDDMTCEFCGAQKEWEDCWNGCDDGYLSLYDEDPLFYDEDDQELCPICDGDGGWWVCPNAANHKKETSTCSSSE